jgi:hypothetical protein
VTRQQAIASLMRQEEALIDKFNDCDNEEECGRLLKQIAHKQFDIGVLETVFCDAKEQL